MIAWASVIHTARAQTAPDPLPAAALPTAPIPEYKNQNSNSNIPPAIAWGRLAGRVLERGSTTPLVGASVESDGKSVFTDSDGAFSLDLTEGEHVVVIAASHHDAITSTEVITPRQQVNVTYALLISAGYRSPYASVVHGEARHEGERFTLREDEARTLPGALGDPFRAIATLPGVSTPVPGLPFYVVRGASPGMSGFYLDGMAVPQMFHFLVGGGVVHPGIVDHIDFYPGAYDASLGHYAGGIIDAATRPARSDAPFHGEAELRIYEISTLLEAHPIKDSDLRIVLSGHFGDPGPLIDAIEPGVNVYYWDYQLRVDYHGLTFEALGSYDQVDIPDSIILGPGSGNGVEEYHLMFHRVQLRDRGHKGNFDGEVAISAGYDEMRILGDQGVQKLSLTARAMGRLSYKWFRVQAGLDGEVSQFTPENFAAPGSQAMPDELTDLNNPRVGLTASAYVEGTLLLDSLWGRPMSLNVGVRADVYNANNITLIGVDPRLVLSVEATSWLAFHAGIGIYQQPPSFPVPLPGIDTFALQLGLQRSISGSAGLSLKGPLGFSLSATGYYSRFTNMTEFDIDDVIASNFTQVACVSLPPESLSGYAAQITREVDGDAAGMELLLRRATGRITGWISYTLGISEREYPCGLRPSDFDQTNVLNAVVQVRLPWRLVAGTHLNYATGRPYTAIPTVDGVPVTNTVGISKNNARFPDYVQLDLRLDREWYLKRFTIAAFIEVINLTYSESIIGIYKYQTVNGVIRYDQPAIAGFNFILPSIGVRAKF